MDLILRGVRHAFELLLRGDPQVMEIMWLSLRVSGIATLLSLVTGVPLGMLLALRRFPGRTLLLGVINTGMGLPPVVVGLVASIFLWRTGPLGFQDTHATAEHTAAALRTPRFLLGPGDHGGQGEISFDILLTGGRELCQLRRVWRQCRRGGRAWRQRDLGQHG